MFASSYNPLLALLSLFVAILASYTALDMAGRVVTTQGRAALWWLIGDASAMGLDIRSMHFVGMLALNLPIPVRYDMGIALVSLAIDIGASTFALWLVSRRELPWPRLVGGALLMEAGVAGIHYTGVAALHMNPSTQYNPGRFGVSVVIAVLASSVVLWTAFRLRRQSRCVRALRASSAVVTGVAIASMYYTGMSMAAFPLGSVYGVAHIGANAEWLVLVIIIVTLAVPAIAFIISVPDLRMEAHIALLANPLATVNKELAHLALYDNLTKLSNRVLLEDRLTQAIRTAEREKHRFVLMFMDLDGFKTVNDVYDHHVGDLLLIDVAQCIDAWVRQQDTVARVGGDEFVVLAYMDDPEDAGTLANALLEVVREPFMAGGHELRVSTSIGIAIYPGDGGNQHGLLTNADVAMYHAKGLGQNAHNLFEPSMDADAHQQSQLVQDLRRAVEQHELALHYRSEFNAPNGPIMGIEALVRWQHPQHGLVPADEFIPLAEKTGLIVPLGTWVLGEAYRQMVQWQHEEHSGWSVAVSLSALQFGHVALIDSVRDMLACHALDPRSLTLEITESTAMRDVDVSLQILQRLDAMGVRISIDDFGTGYSSLLYLKRLPASELKVGRGFMHDLTHDTEDAAIVSAIVALGQTLNLRIAAKGVKTAEQQALFTQLGCHSLQGHLLGRPMTAESLSVIMA